MNEEKEDEKLLRPHKTAERIVSYKSELKRMEFEKTRISKRETLLSSNTSHVSEYIPKPKSIKKLPSSETPV